MKPATFEEALRLYEKMIINQMKKLSLYKDYDMYYQCGVIGLWYAYERYEEGKGDFSAYALRTVRGYLLSELHREKRSEQRFVNLEESRDPVCVQEEGIDSYVSCLEDRERQVIVDKFVYGFSIGEIAANMELNQNQARYLYRRALKAMREQESR
ncbi:sigma-70 family RNA polymerase sigma factor [Ectobacillus antri]|jgi:RNA polymerase sigma factor (sigma-70 family)|uniref:Sigma-70 family RNA polymerase sigma factor n=1 Tax=Ectobacillus antri TaxID=2486280 RepID=A0ABT6H8G6_9BACI|nr:sigma-70 family RNA polymerase sigma factor [Ectobacillus antri]MDG4658555.1 sigma-70 family RNA polymerase sigma factor [Ectobacillus antri]MDG5755559.1 sigma-70 family RNA polymerase sigma factor [Ectobacillus antri]